MLNTRNGRGGRGAFGAPGAPFVPAAFGSAGVSTPEAPLSDPDRPLGSVSADVQDITMGPYIGPATTGVFEADNTAAMLLYGPNNGLRRAVFQSPLFDLRGDFGAQHAAAAGATRIPADVMLGVKYRYFANIRADFTGTNGPDAFAWYYLEFGHPTQPKVAYNTDVTPPVPHFLLSRQPITSDILSGYAPNADTRQATLRFCPEGNLRYWGVAIVCDLVGQDTGFDPAIQFVSSLH